MTKISSSTTTRKPSYWTTLEAEAGIRDGSRMKADRLFRDYLLVAEEELAFPRTLDLFVEDFWIWAEELVGIQGRLTAKVSGDIEGLIEILRDEDWARITGQNPVTA